MPQDYSRPICIISTFTANFQPLHHKNANERMPTMRRKHIDPLGRDFIDRSAAYTNLAKS